MITMVPGGAEAVSLHPRYRLAARALGNVFLGAAVGLFSYYTVTGLVTDWEQRALLEVAAELGSMGDPDPGGAIRPSDPDPDQDPGAGADPEPVLTGWETWREEDIAYWRELEDRGVFGRLVIEEMGLDAVVVKGADSEALKMGPGWIPYTDVPAEDSGNVGIAGHRTTYGAPFRQLDELEAGDTISLYSPFRHYLYEVVDKLTVTPDQVDVVRSTETPTLTLTACHPPYSARYRLIVRSRLVGMQVLDGSAAPATP